MYVSLGKEKDRKKYVEKLKQCVNCVKCANSQNDSVHQVETLCSDVGTLSGGVAWGH